MADPNPHGIGPGKVLLVVGPSGSGKDTLLAGAGKVLADLDSVHFPRRLITRTPDPTLEDHDALTVEQFTDLRDAGAFALHWQAHGLHYAIPANIDHHVRAGACVVFNGSRSVVSAAMERYRTVIVVEVTAPPELLAQRLASRGRESRAQIAGRLNRANWSIPTDVVRVRLENTGTVTAGIETLVELIRKSG